MLMSTHLSGIYYICRSLRRGASCGRWLSLWDSSAVPRAEKMENSTVSLFSPSYVCKLGSQKRHGIFSIFLIPKKSRDFSH